MAVCINSILAHQNGTSIVFNLYIFHMVIPYLGNIKQVKFEMLVYHLSSAYMNTGDGSL